MKATPEDRQRLRDAVNSDVKDDSARIMLHRAINAWSPIDTTTSFPWLWMECAACGAKPGSPTLCKSCLHNRDLIGRLIRELATLREDMVMLLEVAAHDAANLESKLKVLIAKVSLERQR